MPGPRPGEPVSVPARATAAGTVAMAVARPGLTQTAPRAWLQAVRTGPPRLRRGPAGARVPAPPGWHGPGWRDACLRAWPHPGKAPRAVPRRAGARAPGRPGMPPGTPHAPWPDARAHGRHRGPDGSRPATA